MTVHNLQEAEEILRAYIPARDHLTREDTVLTRIKKLARLLGNPQDQMKVVHIAGTSGKTSTAYYMAALLKAAGKKVGLTVSPHINSITERIQINGRPISEKKFCSELGEFMEIVKLADHRPTYFELLYAFTVWVMARQKVEYAVIETGIGGLLDATNIVTRPDKVCIITDIGFDHMHLLGSTLSEIAAQKAGIIHDGNSVFMYRQSAEVMEAIKQRADQYHALLTVVNQAEAATPNLQIPDYQLRNWSLARRVYEYLIERDKLPHLTSQVLQKTQQTQVPGRMETHDKNGKIIVVDGAHNGQKMSAFVDSFKKLYPGVKPAILLSVKTGKEYQELVPLLAPLASRLITTTYTAMQDLPINSLPPNELAKAFEKHVPTESIADTKTAFERLISGPEKVCVITGSFYFIGQLKSSKILE